MHKTPFAGLTAPEPNDGTSVDNSSFVLRNPDLTDHFLEIGAVTHRHDAHAALAGPGSAAAVTIEPDTGFIYPDTVIHLGYTLTDDQGGETLLSPITTVTTSPPYDPPHTPISGSASYGAGNLLANTYYYAISLMDGQGGETLCGPTLSIDRVPGPASGQIQLSNLRADFVANNAIAWRLYKARSGEPLGFFASGSTDTFTDTGAGCVDCGQPPPVQNLTNRRNTLHVTVPAGPTGVPSSGAVAFRLYASQDGSFSGSCLLGEYPVSSAGTGLVFPSLAVIAGEPPDVPTTIRGAARIAEGDIVGLTWRPPVAASGALPVGPLGDVRLALDDHQLYYASAPGGGSAGGSGWMRIPHIHAVSGSAGTVIDPIRLHFPQGSVTNVGGSAVINIGGTGGGGGGSGATGATGPTGPPGPAGAGSVAVGLPRLLNRSEIDFVGSGGMGVAVTDIGGGSAQVLIGPPPDIDVGGGGGGGGAAGAVTAYSANHPQDETYASSAFGSMPTPDSVSFSVVGSALMSCEFMADIAQPGAGGIAFGLFVDGVERSFEWDATNTTVAERSTTSTSFVPFRVEGFYVLGPGAHTVEIRYACNSSGTGHAKNRLLNVVVSDSGGLTAGMKVGGSGAASALTVGAVGFAGSGEIGVVVQDIGGGSAQVLIGANPDTGGGGGGGTYYRKINSGTVASFNGTISSLTFTLDAEKLVRLFVNFESSDSPASHTAKIFMDGVQLKGTGGTDLTAFVNTSGYQSFCLDFSQLVSWNAALLGHPGPGMLMELAAGSHTLSLECAGTSGDFRNRRLRVHVLDIPITDL